MGHGGGEADQGLDPAQAHGEAEDLQCAQERADVLARHELEREQAAGAVRLALLDPGLGVVVRARHENCLLYTSRCV